MAKREKAREDIDLESCQRLMGEIEHTVRGLADYGSAFVARNWCNDNETHDKVSGIYKDTVHALRAAYRGLSVAEEILEAEAAQMVPVKRPSVMRRLLLSGG
jgi:hypothetical protein